MNRSLMVLFFMLAVLLHFSSYSSNSNQADSNQADSQQEDSASSPKDKTPPAIVEITNEDNNKIQFQDNDTSYLFDGRYSLTQEWMHPFIRDSADDPSKPYNSKQEYVIFLSPIEKAIQDQHTSDYLYIKTHKLAYIFITRNPLLLSLNKRVIYFFDEIFMNRCQLRIGGSKLKIENLGCKIIIRF